MRKDLKELKTEALDFPVEGNSKFKSFYARKAGVPVVLEPSG